MGFVMQGSTETRNCKLVLRYFDGEWHREELVTPLITFAELGRLASEAAKELDAKYGNSHFWTVDAKNMENQSYYQLFHGRLS